MSARRRIRRRPPAEDSIPIDPFGDTGPGDPGYRLRGGRTGFDPVDNASEQGRFMGMALHAFWSNPFARTGILVFAGFFLWALIEARSYTALGVLGLAGVGILVLALIAGEDLRALRARNSSEGRASDEGWGE